MKGVSKTLSKLAEIKDIEIWHVNPTSGSSEHASKTFHKVSISEMNSIYKNVDVLVKMSRVEGMFGPPLEAFHSGATAIVSKVTGFDEYIKHRVNSLAVDVDDFEGMKSLIVELDKDRDLLVSLKLGAIATAKDWKSIEESRNEFVSICKIVMRSAIVGSIDREEMESNLQKCILKEFIPFDLLGE
jgi:glycosyltransferase involved in cell wall biosynthesis